MEIKFSAVKKKAFLAFFISTLALLAVYYIYQVALHDMRNSVEKLAQPNNKLSAVNELYFEINKSEKSFRSLIISDSEHALNKFIIEVNNIQNQADSLSKLCKDNNVQIALMDSIQFLLLRRNELLLDYLKYKENFKKNNPIHKQISKLNSIVKTEQQSDKALVRSKEEKKTSYKIDTLSIFQEKQTFWNKIFNRNNNIEVKLGNTKKETIQTSIDTVIISQRNEQHQSLQKMLEELSQLQTASLKKNQLKELKIIQFEKHFNSKISELLLAIENEFLIQTQVIKANAETTILNSIDRLNTLLLFFMLATLLVLILTYFDLHKIDKLSKLLEKARAKANFETQAKQRFLSNMSHEIRTPLQSIIGYTEQLIKTPKNNAQYLPIIQQSSEHLLQVVNEILDYSRIHAGKFTFEKTPFGLNQTLQDIIEIVRHQVNEKGLQLHVSLPTETTYLLLGDAFRLKQILLNLLSNAIKFTPKGSIKIHVETSLINQLVCCSFSIEDTGIGIPANRLDSIFEAFEQATESNTYHGTGLGLSITKALIEEQGGSINIQSKPNIGSIFSFSLSYPLAIDKEQDNTQEQIILPSLPGEIWMVDDDAFIRQLCSIIFQKQGIVHRCFGSAKDLLEASKNKQPLLLFVDIRMPQINGFELLAKLQDSWLKTAPIIALTAQALPPEKEKILTHGFDAILTKPFKERELLTIIQKYLFDTTTAVPENLVQTNLDISNLRKMLGNDRQLIQSVVAQFKQETSADLAQIEALLSQEKQAEIALYFHKIAGRFGQIGAHDWAIKLRTMELRLDQHDSSIKQEEINLLLKEIAETNEQLLDIVLLHFGIQSTPVDV